MRENSANNAPMIQASNKVQASKRLPLLSKLAAADTAQTIRLAAADEARVYDKRFDDKWFPVRQYRLWDRGYRQHLEGENPPAPRLVFSYHALADAEWVASLLRKSSPDRVFEVREGNGRIQCVCHTLGLIRDITAEEWQSRWPELSLPKNSDPQKKTRARKKKEEVLAA